MNMLFLFYIFCLFFYGSFSSNIYFVAPTGSCSSSCAGDINEPYTNILDAFDQASQVASAVIFLLYDPDNPHYLIKDATQTAAGALTYNFQSLIIQPLFCDDQLILLEPLYADTCLPEGQNMTIYLKTTQLTLNVEGTLKISNVVFDAVEDIQQWNTDGTELQDCLYNKKRCCEEGTADSTAYPGVLTCAYSGDYSSVTLLTDTTSLFLLDGSSGTSTDTKTLSLTTTTFKNFQTPQLKSLIVTRPSLISLVLNQTTLDRVYFDSGIITYSNPSSLTVTGTNVTSIVLQETVVTNYNVWDLYYSSTSRVEGYLLYASDIYSGTIQINGCFFGSLASSLRNYCLDQTTTNYALPMNNLLSTSQRSRGNLWYQYENSLNDNTGKSSLIYITSFDGGLAINGSTFQNIIGTSGSVLRIDDIVTANNWFTIYDSTFDGNFAYDKAANIIIAKKTNPNFYSMLDCPYIEMNNSVFTNSYGCPGAYGNNLFICYWDSSPPSLKTTLSSYSLNGMGTTLSAAWQSTSTDSAYVRIRNSVFQNNLLSVSNSLAIIGSVNTFLENNVFQDNGGTTAEIAQYSLEDSYFLTRYPSAVTFPLANTHFGQSSAVYFDRLVRLYSQRNTFDGNWGPWEGSMSLGSALIIKNWIVVSGGIQFSQDSWINHQGIPADIGAYLTDQGLIDNVYMDPVTALSIDVDGTNQAASLLGTSGAVNVQWTSPTFENNILNYDYSSFTYNSAELSSLITGVISLNIRYQSGLAKLLWASEAIDSLSYGFQTDSVTWTKVGFSISGGEISENQLLSLGCLFMSVNFIEKTEIIANQIYAYAETTTGDLVGGYLLPVDTSNQGLFCVGAQTSTTTISRMQLNANELIVKDNIGILMNVFSSSSGPIYLMNSLFINNTCLSLAMISSRDTGQVYFTNNLFLQNNNLVGNVFFNIEAQFTSLYNTYLNNTGRIASIIYMESTYTAFEGLSKQYWNNIEPSTKVSSDGTIPLAAMYFLSYSIVEIFNSYFQENVAFSGISVGVGGEASFYYSEIVGHEITGCSVLGTFYALATLNLQDTQFINNTIIKDDDIPNKPGLMVFLDANFYATNLNISGGAALNGGRLIFATGISGSFENVILQNFYNDEEGQAALFEFSFSNFEVDGFSCSNITGLFKIVGSTFTFSTLTVDTLTNSYQSQFLFTLSEVTLTIDGLVYTGNGEYNEILPLIGGDRNTLTIKNSQFTEASGGAGMIFELTSSETIVVLSSIFEYADDFVQVKVFDMTSGTTVVIKDNVFKMTGTIMNVLDLDDELYFLGNTIFTNAYYENLIFEEVTSLYISDNQFIRVNNDNYDSLPTSQVEITDSEGTVSIENNIFLSLYGTNGILMISSATYPCSASLLKNTFIDNIASNGGAVYIDAEKSWTTTMLPTVNIEASTFIGNQAITWNDNQGRGGAIYQTTDSETEQETNIISSVFVGNSADGLGGAIFFDYAPPSTDSACVFEENYAVQLNHIGSYPVRLIEVTDSSSFTVTYIPGTTITDSQDSDYYEWDEIASGVETDQTFVFALVDMFNQVVYNDDSSILTLYPKGFSSSTRSQFYSEEYLTASSGLYTLEDFTFNYKVNKALNVTFTSSAVPTFTTIPVSDLKMSESVIVRVSFRGCGQGEYNVQSGGLTTCAECPSGYWQVDFSTSATTCTACDATSTLCLGGTNVGPRYGYWRMNGTADIVMECPRQESCLGNADVLDTSNVTLNAVGTCADTYVGNLCNECIDGWAKGNSGDCVDCDTNVISYVLIVAMILIQVIVIAFGVREMMKFGEEFLEGNHVETKTAVLFRILLSYAQVFSLIFDIDINWPNLMESILGITGKVSALSDSLFVVDCFFLLGKKAFGADIIFMKALWTAITPFFYILMGMSFWIIYFKIKGRPIRNNKNLRNLIIMTMVIICFDQQPQVIQSGFSLLDCVNLYRTDTRVTFLQDAYDIRCWQGEHLGWMLALALPSLGVWILVLPGSVMHILRKNRGKLNDEDIVKRYSFVYNGYQQKFFYWEAIIMLRKILFIMNNVFANDVDLQIYLALILLFVSYIFHKYTLPYDAESLNELERVSLFSLGTFIICGLYFQTASAGSVVDALMIIVGVTGNLYFLIYFAKLFFALQIEKLKKNEKFMKIFDYIQKKFCCCIHSPKVKKALTRARTNFRKISSGFRKTRTGRDSMSSNMSSSKTNNLRFSFAQDSILSPSVLGSPKKEDSSKMPMFQLDPRALELSGLSPIEEPISGLGGVDLEYEDDQHENQNRSSVEGPPSNENSPNSAKSIFDYKSILASPGRSVDFRNNGGGGSESGSTFRGYALTRGTTLFQKMSSPEPNSAELSRNSFDPEKKEAEDGGGSNSARNLSLQPQAEGFSTRSRAPKKSIFAQDNNLRKRSEDIDFHMPNDGEDDVVVIVEKVDNDNVAVVDGDGNGNGDAGSGSDSGTDDEKKQKQDN